MPTLADIELSSVFLNPTLVSESPFFLHKKEEFEDKGGLILFSSFLGSFFSCTRRSLNTRIVGFRDNTLENCVDDFLFSIQKISGKDRVIAESEDDKPRSNHFHRVIDPFSLPWKPKEKYLKWLSERHSLRNPLDKIVVEDFSRSIR